MNITETIRDQNDHFRQGGKEVPGRTVVTQGIQGLLLEAELELPDIMQAVQRFDSFTEDNDPHGEHDFAQFDFHNNRTGFSALAKCCGTAFGKEGSLPPLASSFDELGVEGLLFQIEPESLRPQRKLPPPPPNQKAYINLITCLHPSASLGAFYEQGKERILVGYGEDRDLYADAG